MTFPLAQQVAIRTHSGSATDAHGNPIDSWSAPVTTAVYGWAPAGTAEPFDVGRDAVTWDLDLYVPSEFACDRKDRIVVLGVEYEVEGRVESFDFGPFGFTPGGRVRLKAVEG